MPKLPPPDSRKTVQLVFYVEIEISDESYAAVQSAIEDIDAQVTGTNRTITAEDIDSGRREVDYQVTSMYGQERNA